MRKIESKKKARKGTTRISGSKRSGNLGLGGVRASFDKTYMQPGRYIGVINEVVHDVTKKGDNAPEKPYFRVGLTVVHVDPDGPAFTLRGKTRPFLKLGDTPADVMSQDQWGYWLRDWKAFLLTALEIDEADIEAKAAELVAAVEKGELPEDLSEYDDYIDEVEDHDSALDAVWQQISDGVVSEDNPLAGTLIMWESRNKRKKDARELDEEDINEDEHIVTNTTFKRVVGYGEFQDLASEQEMAALVRVLPDIQERIENESAA